jgi:hypothetical protein
MNTNEIAKRVSTKVSTTKSSHFLLRLALVLVAVLSVETSFATAAHAAPLRFSQAQINSYVKIVTAEIELTNNRGANFGASATSKLYCHPTVFGQGVRSGNAGLYVWVTCSAMKKLELSSSRSSSPACTGFSVPVWIEANATKVSYRAISSGSEYIAYKSSAPSDVQIALDAQYNQIYASGSNTPAPSTVRGKTVASFASLASCK